MPERILGLDIDEDSITAVQVETGLKGYQITACGRVKIEGEGGIDDALTRLFAEKDLRSDICLASIPGANVAYRNLRMPFRDAKKIRQTLPFEVETMVPFAIDELVTDFTISDRSDQSEILAVSVKKAFVSKCLEQLQSHDIDPDILDIRCVPVVPLLLKQEGMPDNGVILDIGAKSSTMVLYLKRHVALIRAFSSHGSPVARPISNDTNRNGADTQITEQVGVWFKSFCAMVQNTIHAMAWQNSREVRPEKIFFTGVGALYPGTGKLLTQFLDIPAEQIDLSRDKRVRMGENVAHIWNPALMDGALALSLRDGKEGEGFNFRKGEFEIKKSGFWLQKEFRRAMVLLIIVLSFLIADFGVDYYFLKKRHRMLDGRITEVFQQTFPDVKRIVDPVQQMKVKINELKRSAVPIPGTDSDKKVLELLKDISERIPKSLSVKVGSMVIDQESVRMSGRTDNFNTVDSIKNGLEASTKYFSDVSISSANLDRTGKEVRFELKLQLVK